MTCSVKVTQGAGSQTPGSLPGLRRVHHGSCAEASLSGSPHHSCIPHQPEDSLGLETDPDSFPIKPGSQCGPAPGFFVFPQSCPDDLRAFPPAFLRNHTLHPVESFWSCSPIVADAEEEAQRGAMPGQSHTVSESAASLQCCKLGQKDFSPSPFS